MQTYNGQYELYTILLLDCSQTSTSIKSNHMKKQEITIRLFIWKLSKYPPPPPIFSILKNTRQNFNPQSYIIHITLLGFGKWEQQDSKQEIIWSPPSSTSTHNCGRFAQHLSTTTSQHSNILWNQYFYTSYIFMSFKSLNISNEFYKNIRKLKIFPLYLLCWWL
jgi:hypothetical protein